MRLFNVKLKKRIGMLTFEAENSYIEYSENLKTWIFKGTVLPKSPPLILGEKHQKFEKFLYLVEYLIDFKCELTITEELLEYASKIDGYNYLIDSKGHLTRYQV